MPRSFQAKDNFTKRSDPFCHGYGSKCTGVSCTKLLEPDGGIPYLKAFPKLDYVTDIKVYTGVTTAAAAAL